MKRFIQSYGISAIIVAIYAFIKLPVLRLDFLSFISVLIIFFGVAGILDMMLDRGEHTSKLAKYNFGIAIVLIIFNIVAPFITSSPILHAKAYRNLIGEVKESKFTKDQFLDSKQFEQEECYLLEEHQYLNIVWYAR